MTKFETLTLIISGIALLISLIVYYENRKRLTVVWDDNLEVIDSDRILVAKSFVHEKIPCLFKLSVTIVNPSPIDIGYFNLRAFNPKNDMNLEIITERAVPPYSDDKNVFQLFENDRCVQQDIPKRTFGIFPANSSTRWDLILFACENIEKQLNDEIRITFKFAETRWWFQKEDPHSTTGFKNYKYFSNSYKISAYQELLQVKPPTKEKKK